MRQSGGQKKRDWIDILVLVILALSLLAGLALRTYKMDWDRGHFYAFHPDERALVYSAINNISFPLPPNLSQLLRPDSPLNPHFFNYGNLPMYLIRAGSTALSLVVKNAWTSDGLWMAGRGLSAMFDIFTVLLVFLIGRKLYGRRVGVLAAVFSSFMVLHIQLSHFLTVDTFLTTFITLGMYFAIDIVRKGSLTSGLLMGVALGMAMGTKVSVAPLVLSIFVAWLVWAWRGSSDPSIAARQTLTRGDRAAKALLGVIIACLAAGLLFVVTMPYAIIDWTSFIRSVDEQSRMVRGIADYPYTRQYLNTPIFLYQIQQTTVWGMGIPLGIVCYAGLAMVTIRTIRRRRSEEIVLLSWVLVYFFINGIFQVKFLRYMLPLFPFLAIMGAEFLWQLWDWAGKPHTFRLQRPRIPSAHAQEKDDGLATDPETEAWEQEKAQEAGPAAKPARPGARPRRRARQISLAASGADDATDEAEPAEPGASTPVPPDEPRLVQSEPAETPGLPVAEPAPAQAAGDTEAVDLGSQAEMAAAPLVAEQAGQPSQPAVWLTEPLPAARDQEPPPTARSPREAMRRWTRAQWVVGGIMVFVVVSVVFNALAFVNIYRQPHPWVTISDWIYRNIPAGSTIANEHWDDALPLARRIDGRQRTYEEYKHAEMKNYEDDNQAKLDMIVGNLLKSDYIVLASNRLYDTITRLPERYPITSRYYQLLFGGDLGFDLVAAAEAYPNLAGVTIKNNTLVDPPLEEPPLLQGSEPSGLVIDLGKADESFTVYDHPMPLVFKKTKNLSEAELRALFSGTVEKAQQYQANRQRSGSGRSAARITKTFLMSDAVRKAQEAGGTFMALFNPGSLPNRFPVLVWWLCLELIGLIVLPIGFVVFGNLRDRGYLIQKTAGLLLVAYLPWLAGSLHLAPFGRASVALSMIIMAILSFLIMRRRERAIMTWIRDNRWLILVSELLFAAVFLVFVGIRALNPDLWQPWNGGEKPMEFAFLGAIAKSTYFPPYDPFFAGGYINYYYYGQYVGAMLIRFLGITPAVGFNLIIATLFALTVSTAFSITFNLVAGMRRQVAVPTSATPLRGYLAMHRGVLGWALAGALFVAVIGNLATVGEVFKGPWNKGQVTVHSTLPGVSAASRLMDGIRRGMQPGQRLFESFNYWNPSRVIPDTINEFPYWSFLFADLHPHTIGIPFTLLVIGLALNLLSTGRRQAQAPPAEPDVTSEHAGILGWIQERFSGHSDGVIGALVMALAVGSLGAINTWDLPTYLGLILCVLLLRGWLEDGRFHVVDAVARFVSIAVLSLLLYWPFYQSYQALASGVGLVRSRTPVGYFLALFGFFLFCIISFIVIDVMAQRRSTLVRLVRLFTRRLDDAPVVAHRLRRLVHPSDRFRTAATAVVLVVILVLLLVLLKQAVLALLLPLMLVAVALGFLGERKPERVFTWLLVFVALLVAMGVEIFFLRDWLQGGGAYRMNTIFKFHIQVWIMLGLASAAGLAVVVERVPLAGRRLASLGTLWYVCLAILLGLVFLFPLLGTPARVNDRFPGQRPDVGTLDGMEFMTTGKFSFDWKGKNIPVDLKYEYDAIRWLQENVQGSPVIAEAVLPYYREFGARMSAFTGLPTLVGNQHEQEQRPGDTQVGPRENEAGQIFTDSSYDKIRPLLEKNEVQYIVVGQLEQGVYPASGLAKFDQAVGQYLELVYQNPKVKIYRVLE